MILNAILNNPITYNNYRVIPFRCLLLKAVKKVKLSKYGEQKIKHTRPSKKFSPKVVQNISNPYINKIAIHKFQTGHEVPIFDISDYRALNQLIGYAKFLNTDYGDVYYRGEVHLHQSLLPSISRKPNSYKYEQESNCAVKNAIRDDRFSRVAKLSGFKGKQSANLIVEALLQHYGYSTHFIDLVDNHWIALWFGLNEFKKIKNLSEYCYYKKRTINPVELVTTKDPTASIYQYMLLVAVDNNAAPIERGIYFGNETITIDLRSSLPSIFLRPHAQHGLVVRRNKHDPDTSFDMAQNVVAIARLRIDNVISWVGEGSLLETANLFPSPAYDYGYEILLQRKDLFENLYNQIAQYIE